jgi:hypothetical protein
MTGNPNRIGANNNMPTISRVAGTKHIRIAGRPTFLKSSSLRLSPALSSMMINAILRSWGEILSSELSSRFIHDGPMTIPTINIPKRGGSLAFEQSHPANIPKIRTRDKLSNIGVILLLNRRRIKKS